MVECSRVKWGQVEPSRAMVQYNSLRVEQNQVRPSRATVECSRVT